MVEQKPKEPRRNTNRAQQHPKSSIPASTSEHQNESPPETAQEQERENRIETAQEDADADRIAGDHLRVGRERGRLGLGGFRGGHADDAGRGDGGEQDEPLPSAESISVVSAVECGCARRVGRDGEAGGRADGLDRSGRRDRAAPDWACDGARSRNKYRNENERCRPTGLLERGPPVPGARGTLLWMLPSLQGC